jgi:hypothetical protein
MATNVSIIVTYIAPRDNVTFMKTRCQQLFHELAKSGALICKYNRFKYLGAPNTLGALVAQRRTLARSKSVSY